MGSEAAAWERAAVLAALAARLDQEDLAEGLLNQFNREDWRGRPYLLELRGPHARVFEWHSLPQIWIVPLPSDPFDFSQPIEVHTVQHDEAHYRFTDRLTDDGHHIYEFSQHSRRY